MANILNRATLYDNAKIDFTSPSPTAMPIVNLVVIGTLMLKGNHTGLGKLQTHDEE
jgi:hypothetical protein